ncbi:MAG TPA: hypothetical protein VEW64_02230, partial [Methyloceanibacter sp.]|nr:hypothetical protein [Methyloceanibacter sp.]
AFAGDLAGALEDYTESVAIARRVLATDPDNSKFQRDLSLSLDKFGDVKRAQGDAGGAMAAYSESLAIARRLAGIDPDNAQWQADVIASLYKVALAEDGERKSAALDEALTLLERLEAAGKLSPDKQDWKNRLLALRDGAP